MSDNLRQELFMILTGPARLWEKACGLLLGIETQSGFCDFESDDAKRDR